VEGEKAAEGEVFREFRRYFVVEDQVKELGKDVKALGVLGLVR
jgi:hypothetical protein